MPPVKMVGEPDAGNPHVRFDEGVLETCVCDATRLRPTLPEPLPEPSPLGGERQGPSPEGRTLWGEPRSGQSRSPVAGQDGGT